MVRKVEPVNILAHGIGEIPDRYVFRAIVMEAVKAATGNINEDNIEYELSLVCNMVIEDRLTRHHDAAFAALVGDPV